LGKDILKTAPKKQLLEHHPRAYCERMRQGEFPGKWAVWSNKPRYGGALILGVGDTADCAWQDALQRTSTIRHTSHPLTLYLTTAKPPGPSLRLTREDIEPMLVDSTSGPLVSGFPPNGSLHSLVGGACPSSENISLLELARRWVEGGWYDETMPTMIRGFEEVVSYLRDEYAEHKTPESPNLPSDRLSFRNMDGPTSPGYWIGADGGSMSMFRVVAWESDPDDLRVHLPALGGWTSITRVMRMYPRWSGPHDVPSVHHGEPHGARVPQSRDE
jgi:hypothetical protein